MTKPFDVLAEGLVSEKVEATRRLLNYSWPPSEAGKPGCGGWACGNRMAMDRNA
jgi:hypothetical protein